MLGSRSRNLVAHGTFAPSIHYRCILDDLRVDKPSQLPNKDEWKIRGIQVFLWVPGKEQTPRIGYDDKASLVA